MSTPLANDPNMALLMVEPNDDGSAPDDAAEEMAGESSVLWQKDEPQLYVQAMAFSLQELGKRARLACVVNLDPLELEQAWLLPGNVGIKVGRVFVYVIRNPTPKADIQLVPPHHTGNA